MDFKESRGPPTSRGMSTAYPAPPPRRRGPLILLIVGAFVFFTVFFSTSAVTEVEHAAKTAAHHIPGGDKLGEKLGEKLPTLSRYNPFAQAAHKPPVQKNSSNGDAEWHSDWKWLNPFSSTITLDDTRSVLPPLQERPPIYTFYDTDLHKDDKVRDEENRLLLVWRRAWWAQGFRPVILGKAEAMKNPNYETYMRIQDTVAFQSELMRWLAWGHMGSGILANWLVLPMGPRNDDDLAYLRRGEYPKDDQGEYKVKRYETFGNGVFWGSHQAIDKAIETVLNEPKLQDKKTFLEAVADRHIFRVEPKPTGIAFYEPKVLEDLYKPISDKLADVKADGLALLGDLITSHLHATFLSTFPDGINILTTRPHETTILAAPGAILASALNKCPPSPLPRSCPPNRPQCEPCRSCKVLYPGSISNDTTTFTIGTIPHPYTLALLLKGNTDLDVPFIRRKTERDPWLEKATEKTLVEGLSGYARILNFKESLVSDAGQARGIWHTAERDWVWDDLEWRFGFSIYGKNGTVIEFPRPSLSEHPVVLSPILDSLEKKPSTREVLLQSDLLLGAKADLKKGKVKKGKPDIRKVVEAWHMADAEAWKFVRAFEARARKERAVWEQEEKKFLGDDRDVA